MKISVLQFPGTNCEYDTKYAFEQLGCDVEIIWHKSKEIPADTDLVVIPGGFSYGDYLRSGAIARFANIMESVKEYASKGGKVLGICNGFQILLEAGLLPGAMKRNDSLHFISKFHTLKVINNDNLFLGLTKKDEILNIPVAHHDGNYYIDNEGLKELEVNGQILLKYCDKDGNLVNMNGSVSNIAGICNKEKNVFGLMPHPERAIEELLGSTDGINMLKGFLQ
ncbi:phosphoribosylformylglycinamidine synthase I [Arcobacter aquimarinus]|uniref:Phosphoribosylformylglycinamidine synthase subunit PurQ n=1 Tax=Arcobacter aquimarinus TaxID=1315211 RepID=A0AAE7E1T9_9BACT|nr:phosphoribosylformylglycinamidine synthase I [Arcobacter aquimarinus]QKE26995.1 phosphoribosylformylglycinamidine synthase PurLQS, glutaminase subunit PurQ [Arcobacter aquimarinus]RXI36004.1 phosphoribosylformylglycinamidine synthase I [Arcobacter aquimarinus]